jgi:hypothetical protein
MITMSLTLSGPDANAILEQMGALESLRLPVPLHCGEVSLHAGRAEEAYRLTQRALADTRHRNMRGWEACAWWLLGEIALRGDPPDVVQAETRYQQALTLASELGMRPLVAHCTWVSVLSTSPPVEEQARLALSTVIALYRAMAMTLWLPQAEAALAQVV